MQKRTSEGATVRVLRAAFRRLLRVYFLEIEVVGAIPDRATTGRLFAANHVNGLIDPLLVLTMTPCAISPLGKAPLWKIPVLSWLLNSVNAVPVVRKRDDPNKSGDANRAMFERVAAHFADSGNVLIFPEGTSHNEPHILPMRSGAGLMLALAHENGTADLTFQTVGLEFEARDTFRSRALVIFGPVRRVAEIEGDAPLGARITEQLDSDLRSILFQTEAWEDRYLIARVASLFANDEKDRSIARFFDLARRAIEVRSALGNGERTRALVEQAREYFHALDRARFTDEEVAGLPFARAPGGLLRAVVLLLLLPLAIFGSVLFWIPYQLPRWGAKKGTADVASTYKLVIGLVAFPIWFFGLTALASYALAAHMPVGLAIGVSALGIFASLFAAFQWLDRDERILRRLRFLRADERARLGLAEKRRLLVEALRAALTESEQAAR